MVLLARGVRSGDERDSEEMMEDRQDKEELRKHWRAQTNFLHLRAWGFSLGGTTGTEGRAGCAIAWPKTKLLNSSSKMRTRTARRVILNHLDLDLFSTSARRRSLEMET